MKTMLGQKLAMTRQFRDDGTMVPVTIIKAGPCIVVQVKTKERDGYEAIQLGYGEVKKRTKAEEGHLKGIGRIRHLQEFRVDDIKNFQRGQKIDASVFQKGDKVIIRGIAKGKGFQGVVKRHGFRGSPASHGHKDQLRMPGSIGATGPQRVLKGTRMAGRMGGNRVTVKNLEVIEVDPKQNILLLQGAVPGARGGLVLIESQ